MKKILFAIFFLSIISVFTFTQFNTFNITRSPAGDGDKITVAVIDSPIDYSHPDIIPVLDSDLMKEISIVDDNGVEKSWYEINQEARKVFEKNLNAGKYQKILNFVDATSSLSDPEVKKTLSGESFKNVLSGMISYLFSPSFRRQTKIVGNYIHGTHVAGIAVKGLNDIRLINIPLVQHSGKKKLSEIFKFDPLKERTQIRQAFESISNALKKGQVKVVNLSIGTSDEIGFKALKDKHHFFTKIFFKERLKRIASEGAEIFISELETLISENPDTVFVLAAGNEKSNLDQLARHTAKINRPNVVKVAAIDRSGVLASFSNTSMNSVDIATLGTAVSSSLIGTSGQIHLSGTSQAAPGVTNALAEIFVNNPDISTEEAVSKLFSDLSAYDMELKNSVAGGKVLTRGAKLTEVPNDVLNISIDISNQQNINEEFLQKRLNSLLGKMKASNIAQAQISYSKNGKVVGVQKVLNDQGTFKVSMKVIGNPNHDCDLGLSN